MKKQFWIYVILSIGWIVFCTLWITSESTKSTYEYYLSSVIAEKAATISSHPTYNLGIVEEILTDGKMTKSQATELVETFWELYREIQDLEGFATRLGELEKDSVNNHSQVMVYEYYSYMVNLQSMDADSITLTEKQKDDLEKMLKQLQAYSEVMKGKLKFTSDEKDPSPLFYQYYTDLGISDDYWIKLLIRFEKATDLNNGID